MYRFSLILFLISFNGFAHAGMTEDCEQISDWPRTIQGCTVMIESGDFRDRYLSMAYTNRGLAYSSIGQHEKALADLKAALEIDASQAPAYNNRALTLYRMGRYDEALVDMDRAETFVRDEPAFIDTRAHILAALGRQDEAIDAFESVMRLGGPSFIKLYQRALTRHGFYSGVIDGEYSSGTIKALRACIRSGCRLLE